MDRQKLNRITAVFLTLVILVVALMLTGSLRHPASIVLPQETEQPGQTEENSEKTDDALTVVAITPETVQTAIATLTRPETYQRTIQVQQFWSGGSGVTETEVTVQNGWTRLDKALTDGRLRHTLTNGVTTYIWYNSERTVYTASAGDITADMEQSIPTYEDILQLPAEDIAVADYQSLDEEVNCIYAETTKGPEGDVLRYWVSVDTGLLVAAERLLEGETVYRMWETAVDLSPVITEEFTLPDGTVLSGN